MIKTSPLKAEVKKDSPNRFTFELKEAEKPAVRRRDERE